MQHAQNLERPGFGAVDNHVVGVARRRPEPDWQLCEIGPEVALKRVPRQGFASGKDRFLDSIGCCTVVRCDKPPYRIGYTGSGPAPFGVSVTLTILRSAIEISKILSCAWTEQ